MRKLWIGITVCSCFILSTSALLAQNSQNKMSQPQQPNEPAGTFMNPGFSSQFVNRAAKYCNGEMKIARFAEQKAYSIQVENFAKQTIKDYGAVLNDLKALANKEGLTIPTQMDLEYISLENDIQKQHPVGFDQDYMNAMMREGQKQMDDFSLQAANGRDVNVKLFAQKNLAIVQANADAARKVYSEVIGQATTGRAQQK